MEQLKIHWTFYPYLVYVIACVFFMVSSGPVHGAIVWGLTFLVIGSGVFFTNIPAKPHGVNVSLGLLLVSIAFLLWGIYAS